MRLCWFDKEGNAPLHNAAWSRSKIKTSLLLATGADPNVKSKNGWTPLHIAAMQGNAGIALVLLSAGARVNEAMQGGITPIHFAARCSLLAERIALPPPTGNALVDLHSVLVNKRWKYGQETQQYGMDTERNKTLKGYLDTAQALISYGANLKQRTDRGLGVLELALSFEVEPMIELLTEKGAIPVLFLEMEKEVSDSPVPRITSTPTLTTPHARPEVTADAEQATPLPAFVPESTVQLP